MLVFLEFKTTGYEKEDKICAMSVLSADDYFSELINDGKKIIPELSALHHIGNTALKDKPPFLESKSYQFLQELNEDDTVVVHDYDFVFSLLDSYGVQLKSKIIDTKKVTKHTISDIQRFDLQFLRYELQLSEEKEVVYKPLEDVYVLKSLFQYLLQSVSEEEMLNLSFENVLLEKFSFGKYNGRYIEEIVQNDPQYLQWLLTLDTLDADLRYTIEYYLQG
ncbi:3'-5' exonuclease [Sulfurimonas microaerophilic]|uniref:exodeoxyribonuclease X C-terminal domain-containing protein n=1 Tax=Sulfurimonas microaerophilic TaxID=3058392 RepID=UPI00271508CD|nr:3'-5' exonuclease [Sulfurimonas sp. hsl 1-7]